MTEQARLRAAPAPTGELHVGNVRTFLFNWLYARHIGGVFVLRIEDTDKARFAEEHYLTALEDLRWIGLDWDEGPETGGDYGPYRQSERAHLHRDAALSLLDKGAAYRCFCTPDELKQRRGEAMAEKRKPGYDGRCRRLTEDEVQARLGSGSPFAVRFKVPDDGVTSLDDLVVGHVDVANTEIDDFLIMRSDGSTLYQLGVVVDDAGMKITHVVRGDDHLSNTPKQILLHEALGNPVPSFAHVPQVFGPDKKPLSKRHGAEATSIGEFRIGGYLPDALLNYLALLGWGTADDTIMSKDELIERFRIEDVHPSPGMFDFKRLEWMNGEYIRMLDDEELAKKMEPWLAREGIISVPATQAHRALLLKVAPLIKTRMRRLDETAGYVAPLLSDVVIDATARQKWLDQAHVPELFSKAIDALDGLESWDRDSIEHCLREIQQAMELKPKTAFMPFFAAITGRSVGLPIFDLMALLGKEGSLGRLRRQIS